VRELPRYAIERATRTRSRCGMAHAIARAMLPISESSATRRVCTWLVRARSGFTDVVEIALGMSGLFVSRLTTIRVLVSCVIFAVWLSLTLLEFKPSPTLAWASFVSLYALRYAFLFGSFTRFGIAERLEARWGKESGFAIYEAITAFFFAARGLSFAWLLEATSIAVESMAKNALVGIGVLLAATGMVINIWATRVVGMATYYYRDLFMRESVVDFKLTGPYRFWKNPMYGVGQLASYGAACMALSPVGLLASALNQATMYVFNWLIEQPHLRRAANRN
jgi:protein-S-isoprenylcysteine O-methyltransferase Ste14